MEKFDGTYFQKVIAELKDLKAQENIVPDQQFRVNLRAQMVERAAGVLVKPGFDLAEFVSRWKYLIGAVPTVAVLALVATNLGSFQVKMKGAEIIPTQISEQAALVNQNPVVQDITKNEVPVETIKKPKIVTFSAELALPSPEVLDRILAEQNNKTGEDNVFVINQDVIVPQQIIKDLSKAKIENKVNVIYEPIVNQPSQEGIKFNFPVNNIQSNNMPVFVNPPNLGSREVVNSSQQNLNNNTSFVTQPTAAQQADLINRANSEQEQVFENAAKAKALSNLVNINNASVANTPIFSSIAPAKQNVQSANTPASTSATVSQPSATVSRIITPVVSDPTATSSSPAVEIIPAASLAPALATPAVPASASIVNRNLVNNVPLVIPAPTQIIPTQSMLLTAPDNFALKVATPIANVNPTSPAIQNNANVMPISGALSTVNIATNRIRYAGRDTQLVDTIVMKEFAQMNGQLSNDYYFEVEKLENQSYRISLYELGKIKKMIIVQLINGVYRTLTELNFS